MRYGLICAIVALIGCAALLFMGCSRSPAEPTGPVTVPIEGKVVFVRGGDVKSLYNRQGNIEFESVDQPGVKAYGSILEDGSFQLASVNPEGGSSPGAVEGNHRVRLRLDDVAENLVAPQFLNFKTSGITVKVPSPQPIEIKVWR